MPEKLTEGKNVIRIKEESIIFKTLRLLAGEHLISLEEELEGKETFRKGAGE